MKKYSQEEITAALQELNSWSYNGTSIEKQFKFKDFNEAFGFLTRVALLSEKMNHHANWSGVYNIVRLELNTHDAGGITKKDIDFARECDKYI